jgi:predicted Zn-dependent protease
MYSRDEIKALTDKVLNMAKADAVEVNFDGGERSATRWANSSITVNMVQYDQQLTINLRHGAKQGSASTREFDDDSLKAMVDEAQEAAQKARDNANLPALVKGPQEYVVVDAVMPKTADFGPGERAAWVKQSVDICEKKGVLGSGYIPKNYQTTCLSNSEGLFAYYQAAETGFVLTCRMASGGGSGWSGITGAKDLSQVNVAELTEVAANKAQEPEAARHRRAATPPSSSRGRSPPALDDDGRVQCQ